MRLAFSTLLISMAVGLGWPSHAALADVAALDAGTIRLALVNTPDVLLNPILPVFEQESGYRVVTTIGENAFDVARAGGADLVIAHYGHPGTEPFVSQGLGRWPRMVFSNQAALIGPASDPVGIRGMTDAVEAFRRIVSRGGEFFVNNAATEKYLADVLWEASGRPARTGWYVDLGLRDQTAIEMAARRGAYVLWGIVPFVRLQQQRSLGLEALVVNDALFPRVMVSVVVNRNSIPGVNETGAEALQRALLTPRAQGFMRNFRHNNLPYQTWWPAGRNNAAPDLQ